MWILLPMSFFMPSQKNRLAACSYIFTIQTDVWDLLLASVFPKKLNDSFEMNEAHLDIKCWWTVCCSSLWLALTGLSSMPGTEGCHLIFNCSHSGYNQTYWNAPMQPWFRAREWRPDIYSITFPKLSREQTGLCLSFLSLSLCLPLIGCHYNEQQDWGERGTPCESPAVGNVLGWTQIDQLCGHLKTAQSQHGPCSDTGWHGVNFCRDNELASTCPTCQCSTNQCVCVNTLAWVCMHVYMWHILNWCQKKQDNSQWTLYQWGEASSKTGKAVRCLEVKEPGLWLDACQLSSQFNWITE